MRSPNLLYYIKNEMITIYYTIHNNHLIIIYQY